jgi:hypothetical protein
VGLYCPVSVAWDGKNPQPTCTGHFPHHHGITRIPLGVVKLDLSGFATEWAPSWDRPRDHFQDETPGAGHV